MSDSRPGGFADESQRPEAMAGAGGRRYSRRSVLQDPPEGELALTPTGPDDDDGAAELAMKSMLPSRFMRPYLSEGHASNSPAVLGQYGVTPQPGGIGVHPGGDPHVEEPQQADRPYLREGHADPSPGDYPPNNPVPPGSPAENAYVAAAQTYNANRQGERHQHVMPSTNITSMPSSHARQMPSAMQASDVPHQIVVSASRPAPGEAR